MSPRPAWAVLWLFAFLLVTSTSRKVHADAAPGPAPAPFAQTAIPSLDALFAVLSKSPGLFARFHESKQIALLVLPLTSDGTLHFDRAHGLARHTLTPRRQSVLLEGSTLTLWDGTKAETLPLQSSAPLRALAEAFSLLLAADRAGLEKVFSLSFRSDAHSWQLALLPIRTDLKKLVTEIDVAGDEFAPKTLIVREASGDVGTTTLDTVDLNKRYGEREAAELFKVPPGPRTLRAL